MSATEPELASVLRDERLADELHAFLWTDRFLNRATSDDGWSCRDHVVVVGRLLCELGAEDVRIRHGRCMFVQGPGSGGGAPPVGIGQEGSSRLGHAWLAAAGIGDVDLSPKFATQPPPWRPLQSAGVIGSSWVAERPARFAMTTTLRDYEEQIADATEAQDELKAVYLMKREEPFTAAIARSGLSWASSRVSLRLLGRGLPDDLYVRLAAHLAGVRSGQRQALGAISQNKAWSIVAEDSELRPLPS